MSLDKQFKLDAAEKPKASLPSHQRRQKFIAGIDKQGKRPVFPPLTLILASSFMA
jgi:hypothetical protein